MKLLLDENVTQAVAQQLRDRDHDVVAVTEHAHLRGRSDEAHFEWPQEQERTIVTYDRDDFLALDSQYKVDGRSHAGIIILNAGAFPQRAHTIGKLVRSLENRIHAGPPYPSFVHWLQARGSGEEQPLGSPYWRWGLRGRRRGDAFARRSTPVPCVVGSVVPCVS